VYRDIGAWYAMQGQWTSATNLFGSLLQLDEDMNYFSARTIWDPLAAGSALVEASPKQASAPYEQLRQAAIRRFADTTNSLVAERLLRASLLRPANPDILRSLDLPAQFMEKSLSGSGTNAGSGGGEAPWRWVALALLDYRQGRWAAAAERCQSLPPADNNPARNAIRHLILAMSRQRLGKTAEAVAELKQGRELVEAKFHAGLAAGSVEEGFWFDWAVAQILLREAGETIKTAPGG
jgi:tetratricopeptide (TPR) repeat protein